MMSSFSEKNINFLEADSPPSTPPPPSPSGGMGGSLGGLGGLGGGMGGGMPPPPLGGGMGGLGGGMGGGIGPGGPGANAGGQPPKTKFINVDDVWHALREAVKDMDDYPELKLKFSSRKKEKYKNDKSSLESGDN